MAFDLYANRYSDGVLMSCAKLCVSKLFIWTPWVVSSVIERYKEWQTVKARILLLGLDDSGKSALLYRLKLGKVGKVVNPTHTLGFNVETFYPADGVRFEVWDVGGQEVIRRLWHHYFDQVLGLIFVVDSADPDRISEAQQELFRVVEHEKMRGVPVMVLANKQDLPGAPEVNEVADKLCLDQLTKKGVHVQIQASNMPDGVGFLEAMRCLVPKVMELRRKRHR